METENICRHCGYYMDGNCSSPRRSPSIWDYMGSDMAALDDMATAFGVLTRQDLREGMGTAIVLPRLAARHGVCPLDADTSAKIV